MVGRVQVQQIGSGRQHRPQVPRLPEIRVGGTLAVGRDDTGRSSSGWVSTRTTDIDGSRKPIREKAPLEGGAVPVEIPQRPEVQAGRTHRIRRRRSK